MKTKLGALLLLASASVFGLAHAEGVPSHFVPADKCASRDCTCADAPMMDIFLQNQEKALSAWVSVRADVFTPSGPQSMADAVALFNSRFSGDSRISAQFMSCTGYDPNVNKLSKIAGVPGLGEAALDPCFCDAFCKDIVNATVNHELTHGPTLLIGFSHVFGDKVACKASLLPDSYCNGLDAMILADSEIASYTVGNLTLSSALDDLRSKDPQNPSMECTWKPLPPVKNQLPPSTPSGFLRRFGMLADRLLHGAQSARE